MSATKHVVLVGNYAPSVINFRGPLIDVLRAEGHRVTACAPAAGPDIVAELRRRGVGYEDVPLERGGTNPAADLAYTARLTALFRRLRPDVILTYTIKPIIYGSLAGRIARVPLRTTMMSGLGYAFTSTTAKARNVQRIVRGLYRVSLSGNHVIFFHNADDRAHLDGLGLLPSSAESVVIGGSGVDTARFEVAPLPVGPPVFLLIARLLPDKGIVEYVEAARRIRRRHPAARVQLLGPFDPQPGSITREQLDGWVKEGAIEYLGRTEDVRPYLRDCSVYVLPSYREGMPRSVLEAMAMGRPIITSDAPGCRETVREGENGLLVPPREVDGLEAAMERFILNPELIAPFGSASRRMAEERFDAYHVACDVVQALGLMSTSRHALIQSARTSADPGHPPL
ncbi:MAG TPA: glycosyltransferase family 1 protein [Myxococcales bacterium]|nr:glycosyltransferase family 1 protein [Myxococcales bacterium]